MAHGTMSFKDRQWVSDSLCKLSEDVVLSIVEKINNPKGLRVGKKGVHVNVERLDNDSLWRLQKLVSDNYFKETKKPMEIKWELSATKKQPEIVKDDNMDPIWKQFQEIQKKEDEMKKKMVEAEKRNNALKESIEKKKVYEFDRLRLELIKEQEELDKAEKRKREEEAEATKKKRKMEKEAYMDALRNAGNTTNFTRQQEVMDTYKGPDCGFFESIASM